MSTLIRLLEDNVLVSGTVYASGSVLACDDNRAAELIAQGAAASLEPLSGVKVDSLATSTGKFGARLALAAAAQTLDMTSLGAAGAARAGDTNFSAIHCINIKNLGTGTNVITVGAAASNPFVGFFGGTTPTIKVMAGCEVSLRTQVAAGITTTSAVNLKLDPGADTFGATIAIGGVKV